MNNLADKIILKKLTPLLAAVKIQNWCAYQERSQHETRAKLYEYGLKTEEIENCIAELIQNNFLNEERFASTFASGKFRIKKWGRVKIKTELKQRKISDYCINNALKKIDTSEYFVTLEKILEKKIREEKETNKIKKKYKIIKYAISRGYEKDLILDALKNSDSEL